MADDPAGVPLSEIVGGLDFPPYPHDDLGDAAIVDAIVIFRYQSPSWPVPRMTFTSSRGMADELQLGMMTSALDHMRKCISRGWNSGDD